MVGKFGPPIQVGRRCLFGNNSNYDSDEYKVLAGFDIPT